MDLGLAGKVAVVAASSKGLGKAVAQTLAREGALVTVNGRDADTVKAYVQGFAEVGCEELIFFPSSPDPAQVELLADAAL